VNPAQTEAAHAIEARLLVRAAPGSGKTRTLVERVARLLETGFHPSELIALTFTRKAAAEMRERLEVRVPGKPAAWWRQLHALTFHAWACKVIRTYHDKVGLPRNFSIRDEQDRESLVLYAARELGLCPAPGEKKRAGQWTSTRRLWQEAAVRTRYRQLLREACAVDFDGLELLLLELLRMPEVAEEIRRQRLHVLVDEGQDTSKGQQEILDALAPLALFVVGDPGQSIYGFRGAHLEGFAALGARPEFRTIDLPTNYRSLPPIVEAASRLAAAMTPPGLAQVAGRTGGDAQTIRDLHAPAADLYDRVVDDIWCALTTKDDAPEWSGMAVLSPTWALLDALAETLSIAGIPHVVARGVLETWDTAPARQLIDCLRVAVNPHDHAALWSALNAFTPRISMGAWAKVRALAMTTGTTVLDALAAGREAPALVDAIEALRAVLAAGATGWPAEADALIARLRAELGLLHLDAKIADLDAVERAVCAWGDEQEPGWTVRDLLDWYAGRHVTDAGADPEPPNAITLCTIHGAKGLEWPAVWVLGCEEGLLPRPGDAEEPRRLAYVAITRGRERVRMCWTEEAVPSRFIAEALGRPVGVDTEARPLTPEEIDAIDLPF
jgi:superfamily I DNA/RNA helicase